MRSGRAPASSRRNVSRSSAVVSQGSCRSQNGATVRSSSETAAVRPAELAERVEDRQVGFAVTVLLDALATTDADVVQMCDEVIDQRGLADARIPGDPRDDPLAG